MALRKPSEYFKKKEDLPSVESSVNVGGSWKNAVNNQLNVNLNGSWVN